MSLLCRLGRHRPRGIPRWNDGLYFATCERCGCDLVRTAFQGWHVPSGYRVVWSDRPPAGRPDVALVPERIGRAAPTAPSEPGPGPGSGPAVSGSPPEAAAVPSHASPAPPPSKPPAGPAPVPVEPAGEPASVDPSIPAAGPQTGRLPIQDVLAHLQAQDAAGRAKASPAPAEAPAPRRRPAWDFMDDDPFEDDPVPRPERTRAPDSTPAATAPPPAPPPADREVEPVSRKAGGLPAWWRSVRPAVHNFFSGPAEPSPMLVIGLALALAVAVALALAVYWAGYPAPGSPSGSPEVSAVPGGGSEGAETGERLDPFATSSPYSSPEGETAAPPEKVNAGEAVAHVAASLLICREAPSDRARRVRNLLRGREVRVLGYDGAWASLDYRGAQCWARAEYLSPVPPLQGGEG